MIVYQLKENEYGDVDLTYRSHLVLSADCHSAKTGIFAGMVVLLLSIVTVILFFVFTGALPDNVLNEYSTNNSVFDVVITGNLSSDHLQIAKRIYNFQVSSSKFILSSKNFIKRTPVAAYGLFYCKIDAAKKKKQSLSK